MDSGKVDEERLCITGGSAGGYTTLAALAFRNTFKAGASLYGVSAQSFSFLSILSSSSNIRRKVKLNRKTNLALICLRKRIWSRRKSVISVVALS